MQLAVVLSSGLIGLLIGSFLNVVVHRVPRGESVVRPPSACPACGNEIRRRDNVPVVSWLVLRGRCRDCGEPISARYPLVEAACAALFVVVTLRIGLDWSLPAWLYLAAVGLALALIDVDTQRLPDALTLPSYGVMTALLVPAALLQGTPERLLHGVYGGLALWAFYLALWFFGGMGYGDVKLAGVLGGYLGFLGLGAWVVGSFAAFLVGGVVGIALLARGAGRKARVPHGPFMLVGALVGLLWGQDLFDAYLSFTGV